ncbi:MAG: guanylate kinase [Microthrixaceae bacterium]
MTSSGRSAAVPLPPETCIVVISGPGGVGKGTIVEELLRRDDRLWISRSWTTRAPREGESPDAYHFATREEFQERVDRDGFLEWTEFLDYLQGSPLPEPPPGRDVVFEIDVQGAANIASLYPEALLVFVDAPDRTVQEARLRGRGDSEDRIRQRLEKAAEEVDRAASMDFVHVKSMDFVHVINDELESSVEELQRLIDAHRSR